MKRTNSYLSVFFLFFTVVLSAQYHEWSYKYTGSGDVDIVGASGDGDFGMSVATDSEHNVITAGYISGQADMDFSENESIQGTAGQPHNYLAKYDPQGNLLWSVPAFWYDGASATKVSIAIGAEDEIYIAGTILGSQDLDPGPEEYWVESAGLTDGVLIRYTKEGVFEWAVIIASEGNDQIYDMALDAKGNIVLTGIIGAAVDFDPGKGTAIETPANPLTHSGFVARYTSEGDYELSLLMDPLADISDGQLNYSHITCDTLNNMYVSGDFSGVMDIDPGPGENLLSAAGLLDLFVIKYDEDGNLAFGFSLGGENFDLVGRVAVNDDQEIFLAGSLGPGIVDVDPGPGTFFLETPASNFNGRGFWANYDVNGNLDWAFYIGESGANSLRNLHLMDDGSILGTLLLDEETDIDPGPGIEVLDISDGNRYVAGFSQDGAYLWAESIGFIAPTDLAVGELGEWYLTGNFTGLLDFDPGPGDRWLESGINPDDNSDSRDAYLMKFSADCFPAATPDDLVDSLTVCPEGSFAIDIPGTWELNNAVNWQLYEEACGDTPLATAFNGPLTGIANSSGYWYIGAPDSCPEVPVCDSVFITVIEAPAAELELENNQLLADIADAYQWIDCTTGLSIPGATAQTFAPEQSGTYQAELTINDCIFYTDCLTFLPTSVTSPISAISVQLFPNPSRGMVEVRVEGSSENTRWQLLDPQGRLLAEGWLDGARGQLDLTAYSAGMYLVRLQTGQQTHTSRLIRF
jgi:hypothetical protein